MKIMKTILGFVAVFLLSSFQQDTINGIRSGSIKIEGRMSGSSFMQDKGQFRKLVSSLNLDVYWYFNLKDQYSNDQVRKVFEGSSDFAGKRTELEKVRSGILSSTYYIEFQPIYNAARSIPLKYEPAAKSFSVMNEVDLDNFVDEPGTLQLDRIVFRYPAGIRVNGVNTSTECLALIDETISFEISDPAVAAKIEENRDNLRLLFVLNLKGTTLIRQGIKDPSPDDYCLRADLKELVAYNSASGEIYSVYR